MPRSREILLPWDRQPQEAVAVSRVRNVVIAHSPGVSGYDSGAGLSPTFGDTAPSADYRRLIGDGLAVEVHPGGGSNGVATVEWPSSVIDNTDNELLIVWRGAPKNFSTANGYAFTRGADSGGGGWSIYASFTSATTLVFRIVTTSPGTVGYTATVTDSFVIEGPETIAWRLSGGVLTGFHLRSGKTASVSVGTDLRGSSSSVLRLGGSSGAQTGGHNLSSGLFVERGTVPDSAVWDAMRNPYGYFFEPQTIPVPVSAGGGSISATLTQTLADATVSAASTLALKGTVSQTLANATTTATGTLAVKGTTTQTLADATLAATGSLQVAGSGVLAATLADASAAATGTVALKATTAQTLDAATVSATGTVAVTGTLTKTLADASLAATSTLALKAATSQTLADATLSAAGVLAVAGSGTLAQTLADVAITSAGTVALKSVASVTLADTALAGTAALALKGTASKTLDDATVSAQGTAQTVTTGTLSTTLDAATLSAAAKLAISANAAPTLADAAVSASATTTYLDLTAIVTQTLGNVTSTATGAVLIKGSATVTLDDCAIVASNVPTVFTDTEWWLYVVAADDLSYSVGADDLSYAVTADSLSYRTGV